LLSHEKILARPRLLTPLLTTVPDHYLAVQVPIFTETRAAVGGTVIPDRRGVFGGPMQRPPNGLSP
jgi:hypothetical protein